MSDASSGPTPRQRTYIAVLCQRWGLTPDALNLWCLKRYHRQVQWLTKDGASALIDEMSGWTALPPELRKVLAQPALPGLERTDEAARR